MKKELWANPALTIFPGRLYGNTDQTRTSTEHVAYQTRGQLGIKVGRFSGHTVADVSYHLNDVCLHRTYQERQLTLPATDPVYGI